MTYVQLLQHLVNRAKSHILTQSYIEGPFIIALPRNSKSGIKHTLAMDLPTLLASLSDASVIHLADALSNDDHLPKQTWLEALRDLRREAYEAIERKVLLHHGKITISARALKGKLLTFNHKLLDQTPVLITEVFLDSHFIMVTGQVRTTNYHGLLNVTGPLSEFTNIDLFELADFIETI